MSCSPKWHIGVRPVDGGVSGDARKICRKTMDLFSYFQIPGSQLIIHPPVGVKEKENSDGALAFILNSIETSAGYIFPFFY
jgi:hypothetical protein